jgi:hypothetical protein
LKQSSCLDILPQICRQIGVIRRWNR